MKDKYSISIVIPVYNEIEILESSVEYINRFASENFEDYEIIIIESGSTDGSGEVCDKLAVQFSCIKVFHEGARKGIGSATRLGYKNATKDLVWRLTVDLPCPLDAILQTLPLFPVYDCVLSYRSRDNREMFRKIQSFIYNVIAKVSLNLKVKHVNSSLKVFRREIIQNMPLISNSGFIDTEMVYWVTKRKISYAEIPVELIERTGGSSSVTLLAPLSLLRDHVHLIKSEILTNNCLKRNQYFWITKWFGAKKT